MFPPVAPTAMSGRYSAMFFMVSAGHMRTTKGGGGSPDRIPVVSNRSEVDGVIGGRKASNVLQGCN